MDTRRVKNVETEETSAAGAVARGVLGAGEIRRRAREAFARMEPCRLCPRSCGAKRLSGETGRCGGGRNVLLAYHGLHRGEEPPISAERGAGTVFFSGCPLRCAYCQNYQISHEMMGREATPDELAGVFLELQERGAHNVELVTATHFTAGVLEALATATRAGLSLPIVWNTSGYETVETLKILDGVVDVYLADMRYGRAADAEALSGAGDYVDVNRRALVEMRRQVGPLVLDARGVARRGVIIRHLVLPEDHAGTAEVFRFIREHLGTDTAVSLMSQYRPAHESAEFAAMRRPITREEYRAALRELRRFGFKRAFVQKFDSVHTGVPDFSRPEPFAWD